MKTKARRNRTLEELVHATDRLMAIDRNITELKRYLAIAFRTPPEDNAKGLFIAQTINTSLGVIFYMLRDISAVCEIIAKRTVPTNRYKYMFSELRRILKVLKTGLPQ